MKFISYKIFKVDIIVIYYNNADLIETELSPMPTKIKNISGLDNLVFDNRFTRELPADLETKNYRRQVMKACYSYVLPTQVSAPTLVAYSKEMAEQLGLLNDDCASEQFSRVFVGNELLPDMNSYAMCYGGHQFGNWAGQLGDGRAINLGEVLIRINNAGYYS